MSCMTPMSLAAAVVPRTGKVFLKEENICYKMVKRQKSCYKVRIYTDEKQLGLALKKCFHMKILNINKKNNIIRLLTR